jgi:hypothetical protein
VFRVTRRYEFAASHRLHAAGLSEEENRRLYGKCNHPYGHGHNYVVEVSARGPADGATGRAVDTALLDEMVARQVLDRFGHRNSERGSGGVRAGGADLGKPGGRDLPEFEGALERHVSGRVAEAGEDPHRRNAAEHF